MLKIVEIAKAWIAAANPTDDQKTIADHRILVCEKCEHMRYYKNLDLHTCGLCGCPLKGKIFSPLPGEQACPDKRWQL